MTPAEKSVIEAARKLVAAERRAKTAYGEADADLDIDAELEALARAVDGLSDTPLRCVGMRAPCTEPVTHIDDKGYLYCRTCAEQRKRGGMRCRQLRPNERTKLESGGTIRY